MRLQIIVALDRMPRHGSDAVAACIWALCDFRPSVSHLSCMAALVGRVDLPLPPLAAFISGTIAMVFSIRQVSACEGLLPCYGRITRGCVDAPRVTWCLCRTLPSSRAWPSCWRCTWVSWGVPSRSAWWR